MDCLLVNLAMIPSLQKEVGGADFNLLPVSAPKNFLLEFQKLCTAIAKKDNSAGNNDVSICLDKLAQCEQFAETEISTMDISEAFSLLMEMLEVLLKATEYENLFKSKIGGKLTNTLLSSTCLHLKNKDENFNMLSVEIRYCKTLAEGLDRFVAGEEVDGVSCTICQQKGIAIRKTLLSSKVLPEVLFLHLKRVEFNYDTMTIEKLNSYLEFPHELNVKNFTWEEIAAPIVNADEEIKEQFVPTLEYNYLLSAIIVHTGSASAGHYSTYIRQRDELPKGSDSPNWLEFDVDKFLPFDPKTIPGNCFGGDGSFDASGKPKTKNAYILIYERNRNSKDQTGED
jgi:hypothetical protein